jgi:hypothetical protein
MAVDMHEYKFLLELERLPRFEPSAGVDSGVRAVDFPAWRALLSAALLYCHSTGYRLPSFEYFSLLARRAYTDPHHHGRFDEWFRSPKAARMEQRLRFWYESGLAEVYLYVCLVDVFEDILREGLVLYDSRLDWKHKCDLALLVGGRPFLVNAYWGSSAEREEVENRRDAVERERKARTSASSHWGNRERDRWRALSISRSVEDSQEVNGVRLFSVGAVNGLLNAIYQVAQPAHTFLMPESREERRSLYHSLLG